MNDFLLINEDEFIQGFSADDITEALEDECLENDLFISALNDSVELLEVQINMASLNFLSF